MFNPIFLWTVLPSLVVATLLLRLFMKKRQEAEEKLVAATVSGRRVRRQ